MKPPMNNKAIVEIVDKSQKPDRQGKYPRIPFETIARVSFTTRMVRTTEGEVRESTMEVDLPPEINAAMGSTIKALDSFGQWHEGQVLTVEESTNFAGNFIYFRTVYCG